MSNHYMILHLSFWIFSAGVEVCGSCYKVFYLWSALEHKMPFIDNVALLWALCVVNFFCQTALHFLWQPWVSGPPTVPTLWSHCSKWRGCSECKKVEKTLGCFVLFCCFLLGSRRCFLSPRLSSAFTLMQNPAEHASFCPAQWWCEGIWDVVYSRTFYYWTRCWSWCPFHSDESCSVVFWRCSFHSRSIVVFSSVTPRMYNFFTDRDLQFWTWAQAWFFFFFTVEHNLWQNADVCVTLLWQTCG